jgi:hypothetical protein
MNGDEVIAVRERVPPQGVAESALSWGKTGTATGITMHQEAGGRIEDAQLLAGHASTRTTQLYNRKARKNARVGVERVQLCDHADITEDDRPCSSDTEEAGMRDAWQGTAWLSRRRVHSMATGNRPFLA